MRFEWGETKRRANVEKHGIEFPLACGPFDGRRVVTTYSPRGGEARWSTIGLLKGKLTLVVWAQRGDNRRIISARRVRVR